MLLRETGLGKRGFSHAASKLKMNGQGRAPLLLLLPGATSTCVCSEAWRLQDGRNTTVRSHSRLCVFLAAVPHLEATLYQMVAQALG